MPQAQKQPKLQYSLTNTRTKAGLIPNPNYETKKTRKKTKHAPNKIQQDFITRKNKTKQGYDKKQIPKTGVEQIKGNGES